MKQERCEEAVKTIDLSHPTLRRGATINKITGRSGLSSGLCHFSANFIVSKLLKNRHTERGPRVHKAHQKGGVPLVEGPNI